MYDFPKIPPSTFSGEDNLICTLPASVIGVVSERTLTINSGSNIELS